MKQTIFIAGMAKTGTTILFSRVRDSLVRERDGTGLETFFEPSTLEELEHILRVGRSIPTLTKALIGQDSGNAGLIRRFSHPVLIVRDPRDQFVSAMLYDFYTFQQNNDVDGFRAAAGLLEEKINNPGGLSCTDLVRGIRSAALKKPLDLSPVKILSFNFTLLDAFRKEVKPFVVRYEDIVTNQLQPLTDFLGLEALCQTEVDPAVQRVRRTKGSGEWKHWFTEEDLIEFERELGEQMRRYHYPQSPLPKSQSIPRETSLGYIEQFRPKPAGGSEGVRERLINKFRILKSRVNPS
ncbi:MAG: hypothetical protein LAT79_04510 [Kiritimatiellae bacterium]|nr:hypothetical protein [Kiritimatiellia bacterium]